ncbi:MAG: ABC transporter permease [Planctomycetes bacterium]|nr:ABC transporter permease [Planctomycetota bacterium]
MRRETKKKAGAGVLEVFRETGRFLKTAFGSLISIEFATVLLPLLALWELAPRLGWVPRTLVPPVSRVALTLWDLFAHQGFIGHIGISLGRFALGLGVALATALPLGVLMGWNVFFRKHSLPLFQLLAPVPPPAWVPITIVVLGVGLPMQTYLIFLGAFYPILFNTYQGVKDTDPRYLASARVFGASEWTLVRHVYIPHALGSVVMGIKIGIAMGLVMLIIAEMHGGRAGLGYLLLESKEYFQIDRMVACMVVLGAIGWFLIEVMKYVEAKLALWRVGR